MRMLSRAQFLKVVFVSIIWMSDILRNTTAVPLPWFHLCFHHCESGPKGIDARQV